MRYTLLFGILTAILLVGPPNLEIHFLDELLISRDLLIDVAAYAFVTIMVIALSTHYSNHGVVMGLCIAIFIICMFVITSLNRGWIGAVFWLGLLVLSFKADFEVRKRAKASGNYGGNYGDS